MSAKKKLDPSKVSQSISIASSVKPEQPAPEAAPVTAPKAVDASPLNAKGRYETSFRYSEATKACLNDALEACQARPHLKAVIIQKTYLEIAPYHVYKLSSAEIKDAYYGLPDLGRATGGAPLRLSGDYYERVMMPLIQKYSDALRTTRGANVSRMVILGIHSLDSILKRDKEEFLDRIEELCNLQYEEGLNIC